MKGIVTTQQMELTPERIIFSGEIPKLELKKYLLYWDFIDFPKVNGIGPNFNNDEETKLLFEQGFLKQTIIGLSNGIITVNPEKEKNDLEGKPFLSIISEYMRRALIGQWAAVEHHCKNGFKCSIAQANITLNVPPELSKKEKILR